jgi:hypothetical protein
VGLPGNEKADQAAKEALEKDMSTSKRQTKYRKTETTR